MTSKERLLVAMRHGQPDMVPVAPDISCMIPCRLTGMPFWKLHYGREYPLWRAHADTVKFFGFDGMHTFGCVNYYYNAEWSFSNDEVWTSDGSFVIRTTCHTPAGPLWKETTYFNNQPPALTRGWIKNLKEDMCRLRYMTPDITGYDPTPLREQMAYCGDSSAVGAGVPIPGPHDMVEWFDGGLQPASLARAEFPTEFEEFTSRLAEYYLRMAEMVVDARPDFLIIGARGLCELQSQSDFSRVSLPVIRKMTGLSKEAGLPSLLHGYGDNDDSLTALAQQTDLDVVTVSPSHSDIGAGLRSLKDGFGERLALVGGVNATDTLLHGDSAAVGDACRQAIDAAARGGGFILATNGECSRDTPIENLRAFVSTAREHGRY